MVRLILVTTDNINMDRRLLHSSDKRFFHIMEVADTNYEFSVNGSKKPLYQIEDDDEIEIRSAAGLKKFYLHSYVVITSLVETDYRRSLFIENKEFRSLRGKLKNATELSDIIKPIKSRDFSGVVNKILAREFKKIEQLSASADSSEQRLKIWKSYEDMDIQALWSVIEDIKANLRNEILEVKKDA